MIIQLLRDVVPERALQIAADVGREYSSAIEDSEYLITAHPLFTETAAAASRGISQGAVFDMLFV